MNKKSSIFSAIYNLFLVFLTVIIVSFSSLYLWLLESPKSLKFLIPELNSQFLRAGLETNFEDAILELSVPKKSLTFSLKKFSMKKDGKKFIDSESFDLKLILSNFFDHGKTELEIETNKAKFFLSSDMSKSENESSIHEFHVIHLLNTLSLSKLDSRDLQFFLDDLPWFAIKKFTINYAQEEFKGTLALDFLEEELNFKAALEKGNKRKANFSIWANDITLSHLSSLLKNESFAKSFRDNLNFKTILEISGIYDFKKLEVSDFSFNLKNATETNDSSIFVNVAAESGFKKIHINNFEIKIDKTHQISISGLREKISNDNAKWDINANVNGLNSAFIERMWPKDVEPLIRNWSVERVTNAQIAKGEGRLLFFEKNSPNLKNDLKMHLEVKNANLQYFDGMPEIKDINAILTFSMDDLIIEIDSAKFADSAINLGKVTIPFMENGILKIEANSSGQNADIIKFLPSEILGQIQEKQGINLKELEGKNLSFTKIDIPMTDDLSFNDMKMDIAIEIQNFNLPRTIRDHEKNSGKIKLLYAKSKFDIKSDGLLAGNKYDFSWFIDLNENPAFEHKIKFSGNLGKKDFDFYKISSLAADSFDFSRGMADVSGEIEILGEKKKFEISGNLSNSAISFNFFTCEKEASVPLELKVKGSKNQKDIIIDSFKLNGKEINIDGSLQSKTAELMLNLNKVVCKKNNFTLAYEQNKFNKIKIDGARINLQETDFSKFSSSDSNDSSQLASLQIKLKEILLKNAISLKDFFMDITCNQKGFCNHIDSHFIDNSGKKSKITLQRKNGADELKITSEDASKIFKALGIYEKIDKGQLEITASSQDQKNYDFNGKIKLKDFHLDKTSIFSHLVSLISMHWLETSLQPYHSFERFDANMRIKGGVITISDGVMEGSDFGLEMDGDIDFVNRKIALNGVIIPSVYGVNSITAKIPIIGKLFGDKSGGIVAVNYKIYGDFKDVKTSVNPLSILTPGILRKIFN